MSSTKRRWLHYGISAFIFAVPVRIISSGPKRTRMKLLHGCRMNGRVRRAGDVVSAPTGCVADMPSMLLTYVSVGRMRFVHTNVWYKSHDPKPEGAA